MFNNIIQWFRLLWFNPKSIVELLSKIDNPRSMAIWIGQHITYVSDEVKHNLKDYWQSPGETFKDRTGDCEDFSVLAYHILYQLGFTPHILGVWGKRKVGDNVLGHAVCAFKWNGDWYHFSNWGLFIVKVNDLKEVAARVFPIFYYGKEFNTTGEKTLDFFTRSMVNDEKE